MFIDFLIETFQEFEDQPWMIWHGEESTFGSLKKSIESWGVVLKKNGVAPGDVFCVCVCVCFFFFFF